MPYFAYPPQIRRVIYTTNTIESLNMSLRKVTKNRGSFLNDEAMFKLLYLALTNISNKWTMPIKDWKSALNQFSIMFEKDCRISEPGKAIYTKIFTGPVPQLVGYARPLHGTHNNMTCSHRVLILTTNAKGLLARDFL
jgi:hypothetical protein